MMPNYFYRLTFLLLLSGSLYPANAQIEFFIGLTSEGEYTVQLADQTITLSSGHYRFFDLLAGHRRLTILRNGLTIYRDLIELRPNTRTVAEYSPSSGLRLLATLPLYAQERQPETAWYDMEGKRPSQWQSQPNSRPGGSSSQLTVNDFERLRQSLTREPFDDRRIELVRVVLPGRTLLTAQLIELLKSFTFDKQRLEAAKLGWSSVLDQQHFYQVFDTFTFSPSINELKAFLASR